MEEGSWSSEKMKIRRASAQSSSPDLSSGELDFTATNPMRGMALDGHFAADSSPAANSGDGKDKESSQQSHSKPDTFTEDSTSRVPANGSIEDRTAGLERRANDVQISTEDAIEPAEEEHSFSGEDEASDVDEPVVHIDQIHGNNNGEETSNAHFGDAERRLTEALGLVNEMPWNDSDSSSETITMNPSNFTNSGEEPTAQGGGQGGAGESSYDRKQTPRNISKTRQSLRSVTGDAPLNPLQECASDPSCSSEDFMLLVEGDARKFLTEYQLVQGKKTATAMHMAMRRTDNPWSFKKSQLDVLFEIDNEVLLRADGNGETPLHLYLRYCPRPSAALIRLFHEGMIEATMDMGGGRGWPWAATSDDDGDAEADRGLATRNTFGFTPVMELMENYNLFSPEAEQGIEELIIALIHVLYELDPRCFLRMEPKNGWTPSHVVLASGRLSPRILHAILRCDPAALERKTMGPGSPKSAAQLLLQNSNETMDVFIRLMPVFPGLMRQAVDTMYGGGEIARPGSLGHILEPCLLTGHRKRASEELLQKLISCELFSQEEATKIVMGEDKLDEEEYGDHSPEWAKATALAKASFGPVDCKNICKFLLMLVPLRDAKKFDGKKMSQGRGLLLMSSIFNTVEKIVIESMTFHTDMNLVLDTEVGKKKKLQAEAWLEACVELTAHMVADKDLISGLLLHAPPRYALESVCSSAIMKVVVNQIFLTGPKFCYYVESLIYLVLLYGVTIDLQLYDQKSKPGIPSIVIVWLSNLYFTWRMVQYMLVMRAQELQTLPTHLGLDDDGGVLDSATPHRIIFDSRYRAKFLKGNGGLDQSDYFHKHRKVTLIRIFFTTYLGVSKAWRSDRWNWFMLFGLVCTWVLLGDVIAVSGSGATTWGALTGFLLWIEFFRRLKGLSQSMATFVLMLERVFCAVDIFIIIMVLVLVMFASLFRIMLHNNADTYDDGGQAHWDNLLYAMWAIFRAGVMGDHDDEDEPTSLVPTTETKILFMFFSTLVLIVLMNVLIAIVSESFFKAMSNSDKIFYGARIDLLHSLGSAKKSFERISPACISKLIFPAHNEEELWQILAPLLAKELREKESLAASENPAERSREMARKVREEIQHSGAKVLSELTSVKEEIISEVRGLLLQEREARHAMRGRAATRMSVI
jgi:hypothetical protein